MNNTEIITNDESLIPADCLDDFKKAMKIGYYKKMKSKGLITESQFEILLQMQTEKESIIISKVDLSKFEKAIVLFR